MNARHLPGAAALVLLLSASAAVAQDGAADLRLVRLAAVELRKGGGRMVRQPREPR